MHNKEKHLREYFEHPSWSGSKISTRPKQTFPAGRDHEYWGWLKLIPTETDGF